MRVYLDACCLNRPFDDQARVRIRLEAEAVLLIITRIRTGEWQWIGSEALDYEIEQTPDRERRLRVQLLASFAQDTVSIGQASIERAQELEKLGFRAFDALHVACAEQGSVDVLLTTDDKLLRLAERLGSQLRIAVGNPLTWLQKIMEK
jgi:predicted nucleic acid-binding protein